jgi:hypothetical protein
MVSLACQVPGAGAAVKVAVDHFLIFVSGRNMFRRRQ